MRRQVGASVGNLKMPLRRPAPDWRLMRRFERMRARRCTVQAREDIGDFAINLAKTGVNDVETIARGAYLLRSPGPLQFEKADAEIGLMGGNLGIRASGQRTPIGKSA